MPLAFGAREFLEENARALQTIKSKLESIGESL